MKLNVGQPEVLLLCGTYMVTHELATIGMVLIAMGVFGAISRLGIRLQAEQKLLEHNANLISNADSIMKSAGVGLVNVLSTLGEGNKNNDSSRRDLH